MLHDEFLNLKENVPHGDLLFPFMVCDTVMPTFYSTFPLHWHEDMEIVYVEEGNLIQTVDLDEYVLSPGDIVIIKPCILHSFRLGDYPIAKTKSIIFNISMISDNTTDVCSVKYFTPFKEGQYMHPQIIRKNDLHYDDLLPIIKELILLDKKRAPFYELKVKETLFKMFSVFFKYYFEKDEEEPSINDTTTKNIKVILDYIRTNYMNPITVEELASAVNLSKHYFMRFFKKFMGMTCIEYINDYRLNVATHLLLTTTMQITEVSNNIGVTNLSYFNRIFKKKYGMTPKEYRRNMDRSIR